MDCLNKISRLTFLLAFLSLGISTPSFSVGDEMDMFWDGDDLGLGISTPSFSLGDSRDALWDDNDFGFSNPGSLANSREELQPRKKQKVFLNSSENYETLALTNNTLGKDIEVAESLNNTKPQFMTVYLNAQFVLNEANACMTLGHKKAALKLFKEAYGIKDEKGQFVLNINEQISILEIINYLDNELTNYIEILNKIPLNSD